MAKNKENIYKLTLTAVLTALIFVMAFTPLGYLKVGVVSITFLVIPVVIGSIIGGPAVGAVLGLMFGATSFIQCFGMDAFGTTLFGINPIFTFIMCFVPRILMGLGCGFIYKGFKAKKHSNVGAVVTSFGGGFLNTVLFVGFLLLLFYNTEFIRG
ncbi:MAG: ECF transporter S component, partial [Oscillospiraceae bacterium]|nr:ECF transporter S component [Oscillospiraceae bacterium]